MDLAALRERLRVEGRLTLRVKAIPKSPRNEIAGEMADGTLKVKVAAVAEKGTANSELCALLAKELGARTAEVISGETARLKLVRLSAR